MFYKEKSLKYKNKYLVLKNLALLNQRGGASITSMSEQDGSIFPIKDKEKIITSSTYTFKININLTSYGLDGSFDINLVKIHLDNNLEKPILFVSAGFTDFSFLRAAYVILSKLKLLQTKFSAVFILDYSSMTIFQGDVCNKRKKVSGRFDDKPEESLNREIALIIHNIFSTKLELSPFQKANIHLLGKSNGGWIVTLLLLLDPEIYKGLYLAVPGIPNPEVYLSMIPQKNLEEINFVFGFSQQDAYKFSFGEISNQEIYRYNAIMAPIKQSIPLLKYRSYMENNGLEPSEKIHHELYQSMIDHIILSL
jgi:hypothetical protein